MNAVGGRAAILATAVVLGLGACISRSTSTALHASEALDYRQRQLELSDGLRVVLEQAPDFGAASAVLVVGAGSADDPAGKAGLAHLAEHLAFGATHAGVSFLARLRERDGGVNAMTSWDDTTFHAYGDARHLEATLAFLCGIVQQPLAGVDDRAFEREWRAVSNERRLRTEEGTPGQAEGWLMAAAFPAAHPYAHAPIGTSETLAGLSLSDVRAFVAAHYRPAASTLVVSAPLPVDALQALVERVAGRTARGAGGRSTGASPPVPDGPKQPLRRYETEASNPVLWIGWSVPSAYGPEGDVAPLLAQIAGTSGWVDLGERDRDIGSVSYGVIPGAAASLFFARATLKDAAHPDASARAIEDEVLGGLGKLAERRRPLAVMTRLTGTEYLYKDEDLLARALDTAWSTQHLGAPAFLRGRGERMTALSAPNVLAYAESYLAADRAHVVLVQPGRAPAAPEPAFASSPVKPAGAIVAEPPAVWAPPRAFESPAVRSSPQLDGVETHDLPNGLRVILLKRTGAPFHTVLLGFKGGEAQASPSGVTWATNWARHSDEWSPRLWGVDYRIRTTASATLEILKGPGSDVRQTLKYLRRVMGFSIFWPPRSFNQRVEVFERENQEPAQVLNRELAHAVFGTQPLGVWPTAKQLQKITPAEVMSWNDRLRRPSNAALVIVGDFDPAEVFAAARDELGSWGAAATSKTPPGDPLSLDRLSAGPASRTILRDRPGAQQASLRFECLLPPATAEGFAAQAVFAQGLKKAMFTGLRTDAGVSYSVGGGVDVLPGGTSKLWLGADVDPASLSQALARLRAVIEDRSSVTADARTFRLTRWTMAGLFRVDAATTESMATSLFDMWNRRWPLETLDRLPGQALEATAEAVATVADHCRDNWVVGLLGDRARLGAAWDEVAR